MEEKTKIFSILGICAILIIGVLVWQSGVINFNKGKGYDYISSVDGEESGDIKRFSSFSELKSFVKAKSQFERSYGVFNGGIRTFAAEKSVESAVASDAAAPSPAGGSAGNAGASDYSQTNIQVEGVDEADFVKNDGKYIYMVSKGKLFIIEAYPVSSMKKISETNLGMGQDSYGYYGGVNEIFVRNGKLVVFGNGYEKIDDTGIESARCMIIDGGCPYYRTVSKTLIYVYDITDKTKPKLEKNISIDGNYVDARLIGDHVYTVSQKYIDISFDEDEVLPMIKDNEIEKTVPAADIYYFDSSDEGFVFSIISSLDINNGKLNKEVYMTGASSTLYVSEENIYLSSYSRRTVRQSQEELLSDFVNDVLIPILPSEQADDVKDVLKSEKSIRKKWSEIQGIVREYSNNLGKEKKAEFDEKMAEAFSKFEREFNKELEKTVIHKIEIDRGDIEYEEKGEIYGRVLNQFSLDEYKGNLRIAATTGNTWDGKSLNHVYVLDSGMKLIGSVENLAEGERIYSARFLGERAYMVTFRQVDPLYVIDLKDAKNPKVLGYLKIPGYSDYLHPYDENHVIGIGKDATDSGLYQGLKIALFDARNVSAPKERAKVIIGDRGSDSYALQDHKAFLFDKSRNLLVIPVSVAKINESRYDDYGDMPDWAYGDIIYRGAYVFDISEKSISLRGKITHLKTNAASELGYGYDYEREIMRSLFMGQTLYTVSLSMVKANELGDLDEVSSLELFEKLIRNKGGIIY